MKGSLQDWLKFGWLKEHKTSRQEIADSNHHYRVIQSLEFTLGTEPATIAKFDIFRKKRNIADYDRAGAVSETEADEMRQLAESLRSEVGGPNRVVFNDPGQGSSEVARCSAGDAHRSGGSTS
jgi:hypothetical protein